MVKKLYPAIIVAVSMFFIACSSFLDIDPKNFMSSSTYFETEEDFEQAVNATYAQLRTVYNSAYIMGEMRSDNSHYIFNNSNRGNLVREEISDFIDNPTAEPVHEKWQGNYKVIAYANEVISRIDAASFDEEKKNNLKGQVRFLRAFAYFDLVQYFGGVPLVVEPTGGSADDILQGQATLPRSDAEEIYAQILSDAAIARDLLPSKSNQERGRATVGAANMLLANVHTVLENWEQAEGYLMDIVNSAEYNLLPDYTNVFDPVNKNNAESIFEIQYIEGNIGLQSVFSYVFLPNLVDLTPIAGFRFNNQSIGGWNIPSDDLISAYEDGDGRRAASVVDGYNDGGNFVAQPFTKKYFYTPLAAPNGSSANGNNNWPVYRYAETLLLLAECLNEQNKDGADIYLNRVRDRAFGDGEASIPSLGQSLMREAIAKERRIELAFENKRWLDLVRTGKAIEVINAYGTDLKASGKHPNLLPQTYQVNENRLLFPIPFDEVKLNPKLTQNPGYTQ